MTIELVPAGEIRVGDRVMPEEYDEHVGLDGYDEDCAEEVTAAARYDAYQVRIATVGETVILDRDEPVMRVKCPAWAVDGRDVTDVARSEREDPR